MRRIRLLLPSVFLALAFALTACGGGESDEDKITETIETSILGNDPADCKRLATPNFLEQTQFSEGPEAVKGCEEDAKSTEGNATSVTVTNVEVKDSGATADVAFVGGTFDGQTFSVALVEENGDWKLDELTGFAKFDQDRLAQSLEEGFAEEEGVGPKVASCAGDRFRGLPQAEFEELMLGGSAQPVVEIIEACE